MTEALFQRLASLTPRNQVKNGIIKTLNEQAVLRTKQTTELGEGYYHGIKIMSPRGESITLRITQRITNSKTHPPGIFLASKYYHAKTPLMKISQEDFENAVEKHNEGNTENDRVKQRTLLIPKKTLPNAQETIELDQKLALIPATQEEFDELLRMQRALASIDHYGIIFDLIQSPQIQASKMAKSIRTRAGTRHEMLQDALKQSTQEHRLFTELCNAKTLDEVTNKITEKYGIGKGLAERLARKVHKRRQLVGGKQTTDAIRQYIEDYN